MTRALACMSSNVSRQNMALTNASTWLMSMLNPCLDAKSDAELNYVSMLITMNLNAAVPLNSESFLRFTTLRFKWIEKQSLLWCPKLCDEQSPCKICAVMARFGNNLQRRNAGTREETLATIPILISSNRYYGLGSTYCRLAHNVTCSALASF